MVNRYRTLSTSTCNHDLTAHVIKLGSDYTSSTANLAEDLQSMCKKTPEGFASSMHTVKKETSLGQNNMNLIEICFLVHITAVLLHISVPTDLTSIHPNIPVLFIDLGVPLHLLCDFVQTEDLFSVC